MKKLFLIISILSLLALPVAAQGPGPIYLPHIAKGDDMACGPFQELHISDGTTTVNLLSPKSGFCLLEWEPSLAEPKGGGVWRDSTLAEGRGLAMRQRANTVDTLTLAVRDWTPDDLIRDTQNLRRLLEKAYQYGTVSWQDEPVWIKRHPVNATNAEYTIIYDYRTPQDGNPHGSDTFWTALGRASFPEFALVLEHEGFWRADQPGTGTCVQTSGEQEDWEYQPWAVNTAQPASDVQDIIELDSGRLLATDRNAEVWHTDDGGATPWVASTAPPGDDPYALLEASDGYVYAACFSAGPAYGIYRSGNDGANWALRNNANGASIHHSLTEHTDGYLYLAEMSSNGNIKRSNDGGTTWNIVYSDMVMYLVLSASDGYLYAAGQGYHADQVVIRSQNGTTWDVVFQYPQGGGFSNPYCLRELDDGYLYLGSNGGAGNTAQIYRSSNGTDWALIYEDLGSVSPVRDIVYTDAGYYYMILENGEIYKSIDPSLWNLVVDMGSFAFSLIEYSGNNRAYAGEQGNIWWSPLDTTVGRTATCTDEVFLANKQNVAQLTHVKTYDASAAPPNDYLDRFPAGSFPYQLLPAALANNDAVYFGIETAVFNSGPFDNLILDLIPSTGDFDLTWQYSNGAAGWPGLNLHDDTFELSRQGVCSAHWVPPSNWAPEAVDGDTCYWVRAIVSNVAGAPTGAQQGNRDPYTANWPRVDVSAAQVLGDIPALLQVKFYNQSDEDGYVSTIDELDLLENRVVVGLRSLDRGPQFTAYLNCSDEQNPLGVTATDGANTTDVNDIDHPTGRAMQHTTTGTSTWTDECTFTLGPTIARYFYGSFHAYFRAAEADWDTEIDEVRVRLQVRTGSGGVTFTTGHKPFRNLNNWQLLDLGGVNIPASGLLSSSDLGDETELAIQVWSSAAALTVYLYDLILMPIDEWAGDFVDKALEDDSGVTNGFYLDVDSVAYPKRDIRTMVRQAGSERVRSQYQSNTPSPAILQANADQRLWFLTARGVVQGSHTGANNQPVLTDANASFLTSGVAAGQYIYNLTDAVWGIISAVTATTVTATTLAGAAFDWDTNEQYRIICPNWRSEPWNAHSVQLVGAARYLGMRGNR